MVDVRYFELVAEECAEVIKAIMKIKRFGLRGSYPDYLDGKHNIDALTDEVGQLLCVIDKLSLDRNKIEIAIVFKEEILKIYGPGGSYFIEQRTKDAKRRE